MNPDDEAKLKALFSTAANSLTTFYKSSKELHQEAYYFGQRDALEDIVDFIVKESKGDVRHLNMNQLLQYIEDKTMQLREQVAQIEKKKEEGRSLEAKSKNSDLNQIQNLPTPFKSMASELETSQDSKKNSMDVLEMYPSSIKKENFGNKFS